MKSLQLSISVFGGLFLLGVLTLFYVDRYGAFGHTETQQIQGKVTIKFPISGPVCGKTLDEWQALGTNIIIGTNQNDRITGTNKMDIIVGLDGDDRISAKNGNDSIFGGDNDYRLEGNRSDDELFGGFGDDELDGSKQRDTCISDILDSVAPKNCEF